jgi:hypothetical protein
MTDTDNEPISQEKLDAEVSESSAAAEQDLVLELNFVPEWARKPPAEKYGDSSANYRPEREHHGKRSDREHGRPSRDSYQGNRGKPKDRRNQGHEERQERTYDDRRRSRQQEEQYQRLPIMIRFIPERRQLSSLIRQIRTSMKSYEVMQLASLLVSNPQFCIAKIEPENRDSNVQLYQCKTCGMVASDKAILAAHIAKGHMSDYFEKTEIVSEPPAGQFNCVARCGLTGILLGPPNHHSYADKMKEVYSTRFPAMSLDEYRSRIETLHDPQLVEQWKENYRKQTIYRLKGEPADTAKSMRWSEAEAYVLSQVAPALIIETRRALSQVNIALQTEDRRLSRAVNDAWQKERRFPLSLSLTLRGAFHHMSLDLFKAGRGIHFVTAIHPVPLDPEHTVDNIRDVLLYLREHPGCTRMALVAALCPNLPPDSQETSKVLSPLSWLIEKGHIIEFYNSTLSVPLRASAGKSGHKPDAK